MRLEPIAAILSLGMLLPACTSDRESPANAGAASERIAADSGRVFTEALPLRCELVDVSGASGIDFVHETGGYGDKLLPETMGSGCAFLDIDCDGHLDVFFVNGDYWPGREPPGGRRPACALFRGRGDGTFVNVSEAAGADVTLYGMGASAVDYDGDGDQDLFVTGVDKNLLLRNEGGKLADVTKEAGVESGRWHGRDGRSFPEWSTASVWADVDLDGDVDLLVGNYVEWTASSEIFTTLDGVTKAFATPDRYRGLPCRLHLNRGDGTFEDASERMGLQAHLGKALAIAVWDFDDDGYPDFVVANDTRPNFLLMNLRGREFEEMGLQAGIAYDETGRARAGMGADVDDYMNAGVPGIAIANFSEEPISLYRWRGDGTFSSEAARAGIAQGTYMGLTFGIRFVDIDLDGVLDLILANGHIEPDVQRVFPNQTYRQSPQLFRGTAFGQYEDVSSRVGEDFRIPRVARGLILGDIDEDGDVDVILSTRQGRPVVFENRRAAEDRNHYLRVRLHGKGPNTDALGARVRLTTSGTTQTRFVRTGSSYLSQSELTLTFGLGRAERVDRLEIRWPAGGEVVVPVDAVDRTIDVYEE